MCLILYKCLRGSLFERAGAHFLWQIAAGGIIFTILNNDYVAKSREIPTPAAKQCLLLDN